MFFFFHNAGSTFVDADARLVKLIQLLEERAPWYVARKILIKYGVPVGHGWENTIQSIGTRKHGADVDGLTRAFIEHASFGEKSVRFYDLGHVGVRNLIKHYRSFTNPSSLPLPLSGSALQKATMSDPSLVFVIEDSQGLTALYSSIRKNDERERVDLTKLPLQLRQAFGDVDEIIKIKSRKIQSYDAVYIPNSGDVIEVRVDYLQKDGKESNTVAHQKVYADIHARSGSSSLISAVDMFPAIKPMYDNDAEGVVIELAFATATGSTKQETMRDKDKCLRQEVYHVNGKAALGTDIEPYRLGIRWTMLDASGEYFSPELFLEGRATMVAATSPGLHAATIRKCRNSDDYALIRSKLQSYL